MQSWIPFTELSFSGFIINLFQVTLFTLSLLWERTEEELLSWDSLGLRMAGRNTLHEDFFFPGTSFLFSEWHKKMLSYQTQKKLFMMKTGSTSSARQTHENPKTFLKTSADDHLAEGHLVLCLTSKTTDNSMPYTTLSILPTNHSSLEAGQQAG